MCSPKLFSPCLEIGLIALSLYVKLNAVLVKRVWRLKWIAYNAGIHGCDWHLISLFTEVQHQFSPICGTKQTLFLVWRKQEKGHCYGLHYAIRPTGESGSAGFDWWLIYSTTFEEIVTLSANFALWGNWEQSFQTLLHGHVCFWSFVLIQIDLVSCR